MRCLAIALLAGLLSACGNTGAGGPGGETTPDTSAAVAERPAEQPVADPTPLLDTGQPAPAPEPVVRVLALLALGEVQEETIATVKRSIESAYAWKVDLLEPSELLASAYYKPRRRYRAEKLLDWLVAEKPRGADKIMGLTEVDISTTKGKHEDWGICGLALLDGDASVVSTFRIKRKLGKVKGPERHQKYLARLTDLSAHEFGHQLGLEHCPNEGCIMEDAKGTVLTFNKSTGELCAECRHQLYESGYMQIPTN
jgi:archaemetzincin